MWCATGAVAVVSVTSLSACGGGERQDADEPAATYKVAVLRASFPKNQHISDVSEMRVTVRNTDTRTIPNIAVTITSGDAKGGAGFMTRSASAALADPSRPLWIVDQEPPGSATAYVSTWALGGLPAGRSRSFVWKVTPVVAGSHTLRYRVAAGLNGKAKARLGSGDEAAGTFRVNVSDKPPQTTVDPQTGDVVTKQ